MRLRDIMHKKVETVTPRESAAVAFERMRRAKIRHLVVRDGKKIVCCPIATWRAWDRYGRSRRWKMS
jgi:predicted transcriptional regulator